MIDRVRVLLFSTAVLTGCNSMPAELPGVFGLQQAKNDFASGRTQRARTLEADGALRQALQEWQVIQAVLPNSTVVKTEIVRLQGVIDERQEQHGHTAKVAARRADHRAAQLELLKALALKPDDSKVIGMLKEIEGRRAYASMAAAPRISDKVESEVDVYTAPGAQSDVEAKPSASGNAQSERAVPAVIHRSDVESSDRTQNENTSRGIAHLSRKEYRAALSCFMEAKHTASRPDARLEKYISETRQALADRYYEKGVLAFRSAHYDQAVSEFEQALHYAPGHHKARFYYSSAKELQGN